MSRTGTTPALLLCAMLLGLAGCSDNSVEVPAGPQVNADASASDSTPASQAAPATNIVSDAVAFPGATSNELAHIRACSDAIDSGRDALAMRHARELMDSTNAEVRLHAVGAFGWIGRFAVSELAEMMADADEDVAAEALRQWEMAFEEISSEAAKMQAIEKAVMRLGKQHSLEVVMMKLASLEDHNAVKLLCRIITTPGAAPVATEVAREEYASLVGEPFVDARRAEQVAKILKDREDGVSPEPPENKEQTDLQRKGTK